MSSWNSNAFFCVEDRMSAATMRCKACGSTFEADVEENKDPVKWLLVPNEEHSTWSAMHLRCPYCDNHEEHANSGVCSLCGVSAEEKGGKEEKAVMARSKRRDNRRALRVRA